MHKTRTPLEYMQISKNINHADCVKNINIAVLSNYTSEILRPYMEVELAERKIATEIYFAPFNQFEQQLLDNNSELYHFQPDVIILHNMFEDMYPNIISNFASISQKQLDSIFDEIVKRYKYILAIIKQKSNAEIILVNFSAIDIQNIFHINSFIEQSKREYVRLLNTELFNISSTIASCHIIDYASMVSTIGQVDWIDKKLYFMARIPLSVKGQIIFSKNIARTISNIFFPRCKCLVIDLDNTIWGGVIGEDGIVGIKLGDTYPGNVYKSFQRAILNLKAQGVLLAVASKNNRNDALEVLRNHSDCLLKEGDFAAMEINWNDKATSIKNIARQLNIGLNAVVFFDDNPVERQWICSQLPEVRVIDTPDDIMQYTDCLYQSDYFSFMSLTSEDRNRLLMMQTDKKREELHLHSISLDDFLTELEINVEIGSVNEKVIQRAQQLINKTNQFNLTTQRYSISDIENIIKNDDIVLYIRVSDKYGDLGITGIAIIKKKSSSIWIIDTFLLSCRIIGRSIETVFLHEIINIVRNKGGNVLYGKYIETKKNTITKNFYAEHDFSFIDVNTWEYDLNIPTHPLHFIKVNKV